MKITIMFFVALILVNTVLSIIAIASFSMKEFERSQLNMEGSTIKVDECFKTIKYTMC